MVQVGDDDLREVDLEQVQLLAQDQREQQVEGTREDVEVQLELGDAHRGEPRPRGTDTRTGPTPIRSRTSATTGAAIACAFAAPVGQEVLDRRRVLAQLEVALAHGRQPRGDLLAHGAS